MPKLLLFPELKDHGVRYGRRQIDRPEKRGKFPKRVPIGDSRVGWGRDRSRRPRESGDCQSIKAGRDRWGRPRRQTVMTLARPGRAQNYSGPVGVRLALPMLYPKRFL